MSDLVKRLRECAHRAEMHYFDAPIYNDAADEIETLVRERDVARAEMRIMISREATQANRANVAEKKVELLEKEIEWLKKELRESK